MVFSVWVFLLCSVVSTVSTKTPVFTGPTVNNEEGWGYPGLEVLNPILGVHGFPDCLQPEQVDVNQQTLEQNQMSLQCEQKFTSKDTIKVACVGDSITAGVYSSGPTHTYPFQLQGFLGSAYDVTNLGACGATMRKDADSPYWNRPQFLTLNSSKWDIVIIMLGTNDAKDNADGGSNNWHANSCGTLDSPSVNNCPFADDYSSMIELVRTLGTTATGPVIYVMIPPPLMTGQYGVTINQTVINNVFPVIVPLIGDKLGLTSINVFAGLGGVVDWKEEFPVVCQQNSSWYGCEYFCDHQSCNQCHPNDNGYFQLAKTVQRGMDPFTLKT